MVTLPTDGSGWKSILDLGYPVTMEICFLKINSQFNGNFQDSWNVNQMSGLSQFLVLKEWQLSQFLEVLLRVSRVWRWEEQEISSVLKVKKILFHTISLWGKINPVFWWIKLSQGHQLFIEILISTRIYLYFCQFRVRIWLIFTKIFTSIEFWYHC